MEKYTVFMDWKNQHCQNGHTTQNNLQIQHNPYQITNGIFTELEQKTLKSVWKHKEHQIVKAILSLDLYFRRKTLIALWEWDSWEFKRKMRKAWTKAAIKELHKKEKTVETSLR